LVKIGDKGPYMPYTHDYSLNAGERFVAIQCPNESYLDSIRFIALKQ